MTVVILDYHGFGAPNLAPGAIQLPPIRQTMFSAFHVLMQTNLWRYYFYFLPDQAQILLDHFKVLDEL